jgi:gas vesicle protein
LASDKAAFAIASGIFHLHNEKESTMNEYEYDDQQVQDMSETTRHVLAGIVIGGLIGATAMMFLAPRSGEEMRAGVRDRALDLRDRTTETVKDRFSQVVDRASHLRGEVRGKSEDLKNRSQDVLIEKLDQVSDAVEAVKKVLQGL